jgi:Ca2+/Na+ antiporter
MEYYKYLYYNLFCLWLKRKGEKGVAHLYAFLSITLLIVFNLASIPMVLIVIFGKENIYFPELPSREVLYILVLFYGLVQYLILVYNKKHKKIIERFENQNNSISDRKQGVITTWTYIIVTISIPFVMILITAYK